MTLAGSSLTHHVALLDHGVGLNGQSCSCLIVGWPVGSFIPNPGCWTVDRSCSCLIVGRLVDHMSRTVRGCYKGGIRAWFRPYVTQVLFIDFIESKESQKDALGNQPLPAVILIGI